MALTIQERLKDLRVERGLTLEQLAEQTNLSKSALGSYEADDFKDISHYALIKLETFYGVTTDYLLGLSEMKRHPNVDLADLRLSNGMIDLLKSGRVDNIVDAMSATIMKQHNPGLTDPQLRQLIAAHIDDDSFCRYIIQQDINEIAADLREAHREDFFSVPEDNPLKGLLEAATEITDPDSDPEQASGGHLPRKAYLPLAQRSQSRPVHIDPS